MNILNIKQGKYGIQPITLKEIIKFRNLAWNVMISYVRNSMLCVCSSPDAATYCHCAACNQRKNTAVVSTQQQY